MIVKVFTQPTCPKCPAAKQVVAQIEHKAMVHYHDIKTEEGLAEALEYGILATPSIVVLNEDQSIVAEWRGETPRLEELNTALK